MKKLTFVAALATALFLTMGTAMGCAGGGDDDDDDDDDDGGEGEGEPSAEELADAAIALFEECFNTFDQDFLTEAEPVFAEGFTAVPDRQDLLDQLTEQFNDPATDVDVAAYDACIAALADPDCEDFQTGGPDSQACSGIFKGNRGLGEGCADSGDCADGDANFCAGTDFGDTCGACALLPGDGDPCPDETCAADLVCTEADGACHPLPGLGDPCPDFDCATDLVCSDELGECVALPGDGDPCPDFECADDLQCNDEDVCEALQPTPGLGDPCVSNSCNIFSTGLACDVVADECVDVTVVQVGDVCDVGFEVARYCINQIGGINVCADPDADGEGECTALPSVGDACLNFACNRTEATCDSASEQCVALPGEGEACPNFDCAEGLECDENDVCSEPAENDPLICEA